MLNSKFIWHLLLLKKYPCVVTFFFFTIEALLYAYKVVTKKNHIASLNIYILYRNICVFYQFVCFLLKLWRFCGYFKNFIVFFSSVNSFENPLARIWETNCECCRSVNGMGCIKFLMLRGLFLLHTIFCP